MKSLGIDLGSREVKVAVVEDDKIFSLKKISTVQFYREFCIFDGSLKVDREKLGCGEADVYVSTGYGRNNTDLQEFFPINELKAHVHGAMFQTGLKDFVLLDIGGQDIKVMKVEKGLMTDLQLNDKCAASCGRYLENMAAVLEVETAELGRYSDNPVELNSTCAVFSESELIGRIAEGVPFAELCAGINFSLFKRLRPLVRKFFPDTLVVSGGVAGNGALIKYLEKECRSLVIPENPQYNGAIGAAVFGMKKYKAEEADVLS